ncbi:hypothetical protein YC2023_115474 [Brassica napus]
MVQVLVMKKTRCEACVFPVHSDPIYSCEQCDFILHETCANLPLKKRLPFHNRQFKLYAPDMDSYEAFQCNACYTMFSGFRYMADRVTIDVRCGGQMLPMKLACDDCDFALDFGCFNLPRVVKHKDDEHLLSLCYGEDPNGKYWCDICEGETNPKDWFYTCAHSGVTFHVQCVLRDFSVLMPRRMIEYRRSYYRFEVVPNNHCSRPFCAWCLENKRTREYRKKLSETGFRGGKTLHVDNIELDGEKSKSPFRELGEPSSFSPQDGIGSSSESSKDVEDECNSNASEEDKDVDLCGKEDDRGKSVRFSLKDVVKRGETFQNKSKLKAALEMSAMKNNFDYKVSDLGV